MFLSSICAFFVSCYIMFLQDVMDDVLHLSKMRQDIMKRVDSVLKMVNDYQRKFDCYNHLWEDDQAEFLRQFLRYGRVLTTEELDSNRADIFPENPPTINNFKEQVRCCFQTDDLWAFNIW